MTVGELIKELQKYDEKLPVIGSKMEDSGCSTCGPISVEVALESVYDFSTRIVLDFARY